MSHIVVLRHNGLLKKTVALVHNEIYRPSDRRLSAKLLPTFADRACRMVSATDLHCHILDFLDRSRYFIFQVASELYSEADWTPF
jgi:hypothetical protein